MDAHAERPLLPPIKAMDSEQYRREEHEYAARLPPSTTLVAPSLSAAYPVGPPPPYSAAPLSSGLHSQEKGLLPSLHEALGVERRGPYQPEPVSSRPPTSPRPHAIETSPRHPQVYAPTPTALAHAHHQPPSSRRPSDSYEQRRHDWPEQHSVASSSSYRQRTPPSTLSQGPRPPYSAVDLKRPYEASPNRAPVSRPTSTFPYGYSTTNSSYAPPPSTAPSHYPSVSETSHAWRPSSHAGHLPITSAPPAAIAAPTPQQTVPAPQPYGESVKRHLDLYDLEMSLNDIRENSTIALDFAKSYGARMHQVQRSGIEPGVLPAITEVDALLKGTQQTSEALSKMREVLIAQHEMHRQQVQEQARRNEDVKRSDSIHQQQEESKSGGFAGAEPKKRRGRNAAPGRCHSCNRAETPEWRRGPDGARTLCNACGLHYAKLTRKAGANKTTAGGSSLRPKDESNES